MNTELPTETPPPFSLRKEALFLLALILVVLATRLPFIMHGLDEWDSANFALSVFHFDIPTHQPHPPGQYFYVRLMQFINLFTGNELFTLSFASAVCSTLALVPYYVALRQIFRPAIALSAVGVTAFTFGYWITGLRMISDPVATLFVYGTVCSLLLGLTDRRWFWFGMALCGVTLGVKQSALYFLAPFAIVVNLFVLFRHGLLRPLLGSVLFFTATAAWLLPTFANSHGWARYLAACRSEQQENYLTESIIFRLSADAAKAQGFHNLIQPWGATALAVVMLSLAAVGLVLCVRRGLRGALFALFSATVALYAFFFLYRFNKYYVYTLPFYCAFATAALFAVGDWLARQARQPVLGRLVPGLGIALVTAANLGLTLPLLPKVAHFRAPPQAALEALRRMPGVEPAPLLFTDDVATDRELLYFCLKKRVDLLNRHHDLQAAIDAMNTGRKVYLLTPDAMDTAAAPPDTIRSLGRYTWRPELSDILQMRPDLRELSLYELNAPLPVEYKFPDPAGRPPMLLAGMWSDGWCGRDSRFLVPCDGSGPDLVHLQFDLQENLGFPYPYRMVCRFADGTTRPLTFEHPGRADFVIPLPDRPDARAVEMELLAPQTIRPSQRDPHLSDMRDLSVLLKEVTCVTESRPLIIHRDGGWYDPETDGKTHWRWTDGNAALSVLVDRADTLDVDGAMLSFTDGNAVEVRVDDQPVVVLPLLTTGWEPVAWHLPLTAGLHRIVLHSRIPGAQPPGDGRSLALRVQDLQFHLEHSLPSP